MNKDVYIRNFIVHSPLACNALSPFEICYTDNAAFEMGYVKKTNTEHRLKYCDKQCALYTSIARLNLVSM